MQNQAKLALRKQIKDLVKQMTPENRRIQSNSITQKVKNQIKAEKCKFHFESVNFTPITDSKSPGISKFEEDIDLPQHRLRSLHN